MYNLDKSDIRERVLLMNLYAEKKCVVINHEELVILLSQGELPEQDRVQIESPKQLLAGFLSHCIGENEVLLTSILPVLYGVYQVLQNQLIFFLESSQIVYFELLLTLYTHIIIPSRFVIHCWSCLTRSISLEKVLMSCQY